MTYPDNPQQPHSNPYDKAYPVSPFESEPQQAQQQQPPQQVQQPQPQQQPQQWQQNQQQAPWQGPPMPPQGASQSGGMGSQPAQPNPMAYGPNMQPPRQVPYTANPYAPAPVAVDPQNKNYLGLVAMIMGVLCVPSLIFIGWWPPTIAIVTLAVSIVAFVRRKNYVEQNRMTGFAITGLVLSSVCIAIIAVGFLIYAVVEATDSNTYDNYDNYRSYLPDNSLEDA
jgi:activating signal cointegrator 1 complex subunit 2